ncbi:hypothetical protein Lal_00015826, partial [Lupinus albus]
WFTSFVVQIYHNPVVVRACLIVLIKLYRLGSQSQKLKLKWLIMMIAILDFAVGAMENYGLVTYRKTVLLYDDQNSAASNKQRVATIVAHELTY